MRKTEEWLAFLLEESERCQNMVLNRDLNDASGLGRALDRMIRQGRGSRPAGVLLTGPSGAGKHNAAWHVLQALNGEDYAPVFLSGESLSEFRGDYPAAAARLNALMDQFYDRGQGLCLVLEDPERCGFGRQLFSFLGVSLQAYQSYPPGDPGMFLILIADKQPAMPSLLRDQLLFCPCALPDLARREAYLTERGKSIRNYVSLKRLAELTEHCSYTALGQIADLLGFEIDATDRVPDEEAILRCVRQFVPAAEPEKPDLVAEALRRLETVFAGLTETISGLKLGQPVQQSRTEAVMEKIATAGQSQELGAMPERESIEELAVSQLSRELFGNDRVQQLLQS